MEEAGHGGAQIAGRDHGRVRIHGSGEDLHGRSVDPNGEVHIVVDLAQSPQVRVMLMRPQRPARLVVDGADGGGADERPAHAALRALEQRVAVDRRTVAFAVHVLPVIAFVVVQQALALAAGDEHQAKQHVRGGHELRNALAHDKHEHFHELGNHRILDPHGAEHALNAVQRDLGRVILGDGDRAKEACRGHDEEQPGEHEELH
mmetsp:Transcript_60517/g.175240  ORF Transcript_60517/g.175240 Transcript_60517/m.175240 type:complete len:204 (+) Transcript_60517:288-899(+)